MASTRSVYVFTRHRCGDLRMIRIAPGRGDIYIGKQLEECVLRGPGQMPDSTRDENRGGTLRSCSLLEARERDLPPLPDEDDRETEIAPPTRRPAADSFPIPLKISSPRPLAPSVAKPSTHELVFPTYKSDTLLRPKLRLETGWDSVRHLQLHSAGDLSNGSWQSSSQKSFRSATSQEKLLCSSPEDLAYHASSAIQGANASRSKTPPTGQERSTHCRFLGAVRLPKVASVVRTAQKKATPRAINQTNNPVMSKPFMRSDGGPLHGITVTVHRQRLVSEPMPVFTSSSSSSLLSAAPSSAMDKPLPAPDLDRTRDLPAIPVELPNDDQPEALNPIVPIPHTPVPPGASNPTSTSALPPTFVHVGRQPSGAKRRKHYKVHRVPVPRP
ncbi:hypothetical protein DFH09DRAFT_1219515 [Mycena vulgaris]|nr:hypothetical protein DFH09DRAFT_1219515 [Mycena vulgaris]